jgi:rhodanese-related sulfurtransferase
MREPIASVPEGKLTEDAINKRTANSTAAPGCACARGDLSGVEPVIAKMGPSAVVECELKRLEPSPNLPKGKQTVLALYVTAKEAHEKWKAEPDKVKIIDVRTPEEYLFVGHPAMAWKIPVAAQTYEWDSDKQNFPMKPLPDFVSRVKEVAQPDETLMLMCRSGGRSAIAVNMLAQAGFQHVYNIVDGMEGDVNADSDNVAQGQPLKDGWKNSGCPWTKKLTPERMVLPKV